MEYDVTLTEGYNSGWLAGHASIIRDLHEGFDGRIPRFIRTTVCGSKKDMVEALGYNDDDVLDELFDRGPHFTMDEDGNHLGVSELRFDVDDYDDGFADAYKEVLKEVRAAYKKKQRKVPAFVRSIVAGLGSAR